MSKEIPKASSLMKDLKEIGTVSRLAFAKRGKDLDVYLLTSKSSLVMTQEELEKTWLEFSKFAKRFTTREVSYNVVPINEDPLTSFQKTVEDRCREKGGTFLGIKNVYDEGEPVGFSPFPTPSRYEPLPRK